MALEKTFDTGTAEARIYAAWEQAGCFKAGANATRDETFTIMIPPPNVTGVLHMGHAFNNTLQDILIRWKRMQGVDTLWQPGTDHAGIATQMVVERELAKAGEPSRAEMGRQAFLAKVWEWKKQSGGTIINQLKRLGASCDWERTAFTMSGAPNALEVENIEVAGHMWHFKYPLADGQTYTYVEKDEDGNITLSEERDYISIATTRPETMLGDGAVAVHPSDERYAPIVGKLCEIPVGPKEHRRLIPIITDEYPDPDFGSGAVKITGAHDFNDYQVAKRGGIPMYNLMDTRAAMRGDGRAYADEAAEAQRIANGEIEWDENKVAAMNLVPDEYRGLDRMEARERVVAAITAEGNAVMIPNPKAGEDGEADLIPHVENKPIMQPFGDRSKVVIEPMLTDQWFVDTAKIVGPALDAVRDGTVKIIPESGEKTYYHWLENIEPWCISRQLWWGHQVPVWFDDAGNQYCAATEAEAQAQAPGKTLTRDPDVLDTWFSSGLWPIGTLGWPEQNAALDKYFPTSTLITGQDILFLHGLVRDAKGKKMSKSTGNVIDPLDIIDEYGADALRFTNAAMASIGGVLKLDMQRIQGYRNFGTKLWNAARFAEMNEAVPSDGTIPMADQAVNKWIIGETAKVREVVDAAFETYRFNDAAQALYAYVWGKVCDWYVELSKPLLNGDNEAATKETRRVMGWVIDQCLILLHPIMPFITEELWGALGERAKMVVHADWPTYSAAELVDPAADREMNWVISLIEGIRSARSQMRVPAGLRIPMIVTELDDTGQAAWKRNEAMILKLARVVDLAHADAFPKGTITVAVHGGTFGLPLADIIDIEAEKERLEKSLGKSAKSRDGSVERDLTTPCPSYPAEADVINSRRVFGKTRAT